MSVPPTTRPSLSSPRNPTFRPGPSSATATAPASPKVQSAPLRQRQFVFLLLNQFTFLSFAAAIEPLRIANRMSGQTLYRWTLISENGQEATCSNGTTVRVNGGLGEINRDDVVIVCAGIDVRSNTTQPVVNWLRKVARKGSVIGGLCTAAHTLAEAGLLENRRATIHWENRDGFLEEFAETDLTKSVFVIDGNRLTAAGGTASIDLVLTMIADDHGKDLANAVADQLIYTTIRTDRDIQRLSIPTRIGVRHPRLSRVIERMEQSIEEPVSPAELAEEVGMSTRQLERLFRRYLNRSPKRYYMELRLARARNLLMQTELSVINVALACGFASPSHFSKCYRAQYGTTPYRERGTHGLEDELGAEPGLDEDDSLLDDLD
ncbi:MAG: GlxA family transcriptional regulator [Rhodobacter sp.]|uniref:GlxA family transcriptional regulator n=1 Tax=Pararhodobacter sp. TaxID=2127056 RepID=UPI001DEE5E70|nr:GlxA family transcriptional regulator [Pararhodobacter sp.]MCB1345557.1 GlxA family transcriptional regulator [Paracoccaceae bacterium]MCC0074029.1 GlxA family transcriptional regulator [Rhodobacter sp.]HPD93650.1 GlxA family transcriptional regulator [Pararhodobacter sp.]